MRPAAATLLARAPEAAPLSAALLAAILAVSGGVLSTGGEIAAGTLLALLAAHAAFRWRAPDRLEVAMASLLLWAGLSALLGSPNFLASKETLGMWAGTTLGFLLVRREGTGPRRELIAVLGAAAALVAGGIVWTNLTLRLPFSGGVFENPNLAAAILVAFLPTATLSHRSMVRLGLAPLLAVSTALTGSRAGLAALVVMAVLLLGGRARWLAGASVAAAGTALVWWRFATHPDALAWLRTEIWGAVLRLTAQHPLTGVSPGGLADASGPVRLATPIGCSLHARHMAGAESSILGILVTTGVIGALLALAVAVLLAMAALGISEARRRRAALATLAGCLVMAVFHDFLMEPGVLMWWAVVAGLTVPRNHPVGDGDPARWLGTVQAAVAAGFMAWMVLEPPLARFLTASETSPVTAALRMIRLEPWDDGPARTVVQTALNGTTPWTWDDAGKALFWMRHILRVHPGGLQSWVLAAHVNVRLIDDLGAYPSAVAGARRAFREACRLEPHLPWYWSQWASFERQLGKLDTARRLAARAVTEEPNFVRGWLLLARIDLDLGQMELARSDLEQARRARRCFSDHPLEGYECDLLRAPRWQWRQLEAALP